jgi:hypothetical protein
MLILPFLRIERQDGVKPDQAIRISQNLVRQMSFLLVGLRDFKWETMNMLDLIPILGV